MTASNVRHFVVGCFEIFRDIGVISTERLLLFGGKQRLHKWKEKIGRRQTLKKVAKVDKEARQTG